MDPRQVFAGKAEDYARYRWDYAPAAIKAIFAIAQLNHESVVADIGAGTGILSKHFAGRVGRVYAIEPNRDMRQVACQELSILDSVHILDGAAEATTLEAGTIDLITVAQAIHWFDPDTTLHEFGRILKPDGWLAILRNSSQNGDLDDELEAVVQKHLGYGSSGAYPSSRKRPVQPYFAAGTYEMRSFPFQFQQEWDQFAGVLATVSYMPSREDARFKAILRDAKEVFDRHSERGMLLIKGETELLTGRLAR